MTLYPNPSADLVTIVTELQLSKVILIDLVGKEIYTKEGNIRELYTKELANGIYILEILDEKGNKLATEKLIVQH